RLHTRPPRAIPHNILERYTLMHQDLRDLTGHITRARQVDPSLIDELRVRRFEVQKDINNIESDVRLAQRRYTVSLDQGEDFKAALNFAFESGRWNPPTELTGFRGGDLSKVDLARAYREQAAQRWYSAMGTVQKLDMYLSRGR